MADAHPRYALPAGLGFSHPGDVSGKRKRQDMNDKTTPVASASRHTPEPWTISRDGDYIEGPDQSPRFRVMGSAPYNRAWLYRAITEHQACANMADPAAEIAALREENKRLAEQVAACPRPSGTIREKANN